ncbi:hypothetical protein GJAV_G00243640 [Gymnothorax javanicus]|nr:hypothetical protein GJAV_G00243640 [Gymnothorax javanicus]
MGLLYQDRLLPLAVSSNRRWAVRRGVLCQCVCTHIILTAHPQRNPFPPPINIPYVSDADNQMGTLK